MESVLDFLGADILALAASHNQVVLATADVDNPPSALAPSDHLIDQLAALGFVNTNRNNARESAEQAGDGDYARRPAAVA
ncbi:hypothetical protein [Flavisphingomonas formosensis]|uniref:hypothetical protein n=1 Tax=Flavisphingomonas formosensis TaxID=861534 RepID=UPI0012FBF143|nr:hypothetical protein [Sphingomonas formosensis]